MISDSEKYLKEISNAVFIFALDTRTFVKSFKETELDILLEPVNKITETIDGINLSASPESIRADIETAYNCLIDYSDILQNKKTRGILVNEKADLHINVSELKKMLNEMRNSLPA